MLVMTLSPESPCHLFPHWGRIAFFDVTLFRDDYYEGSTPQCPEHTLLTLQEQKLADLARLLSILAVASMLLGAAT